MAKSIVEIIANNALENPNQICIIDSNDNYTYGMFWEKILCASKYLKHMGINSNDCILVECTQDFSFLVCDFACNLLGAIFVPLEYQISDSNLFFIEKETNAKLIISSSIYNTECKRIDFLEVLKENNQYNDYEISFPSAESTAEILYTTGTTGKSKGVEITHKNNIALAENICFGTEMKQGNVELIPLPISHSHGLRCCYANFYQKGTVILTKGVVKVKKIFNLIETYTVTAMDLSPSAAQVLLRFSSGKLSQYDAQLDYIQIGTAMLSEELKEQLCELFPSVRLYNFYGSTESGRSCVLDFNSDNRKYCIGRPTKHAHFIVTDNERNEIISSAENPGLLACSGSMNMKGYWKQPELTAETMKNGYIYTNDEGYIDGQGFVYVFGRNDDVINFMGIKIAPEEIEEIVRKYPEVKDCACVPLPDSTAGQVPKLFLVVKNKDEFDINKFMDYLKICIDKNKLPKQLEFIDMIPRTKNGKILRRKLVEVKK